MPGRCDRCKVALFLAVVVVSVARAKESSGFTPAPQATARNLPAQNSLAWYSNYRAALEEARQRHTMAFIWFTDFRRDEENDLLERNLFLHKEVRTKLAACVPLKLPLSIEVEDSPPNQYAGGNALRQTVRLLDYEAFAELLGQSGVALIDMRDSRSPHFHRVVSVFPFSGGPITIPQLSALLDLPEGSLTQRTLIWAVRTHVERPESASGTSSSMLAGEAASHARYQASIRLQGHQQWDQRFQRITTRLPANLVAQEICAESWPGQPLVAGAQECVRSWRQSKGHWNAVRTSHPQYGYDIHRGSNGVWYATGIFGRQR